MKTRLNLHWLFNFSCSYFLVAILFSLFSYESVRAADSNADSISAQSPLNQKQLVAVVDYLKLVNEYYRYEDPKTRSKIAAWGEGAQMAEFQKRFAGPENQSDQTSARWISSVIIRFEDQLYFNKPNQEVMLPDGRRSHWVQTIRPLEYWWSESKSFLFGFSDSVRRRVMISLPQNGYVLSVETDGATRDYNNSIAGRFWITVAQPVDELFANSWGGTISDSLRAAIEVTRNMDEKTFQKGIEESVQKYPGLSLALAELNETIPDRLHNFLVQILVRDYKSEIHELILRSMKNAQMPNWLFEGLTYGLARDNSGRIYLLHQIHLVPSSKNVASLIGELAQQLPTQDQFIVFKRAASCQQALSLH